ncbi:hypothetical protein D3C81_1496770 [compost metagenome]
MYLIVSNQPEVLSHFSNLLCFSHYEFERWLEAKDASLTFNAIYEKLYGDTAIWFFHYVKLSFEAKT